MKSLWYSNVICGVVEGVFEMLRLIVSCTFVKDTLKGDKKDEIKIEIQGVAKDTISSEFEN